MIIIGVIAVVAKTHGRLHQSRKTTASCRKKGEKPNNYNNDGEWLLKGTRCNRNYNQCETHRQMHLNAYSIFWHVCSYADTHTHTPSLSFLTCLAMPFSQMASYLLPFWKCSTPLPWNIPSFISPTYLVSVGKVYSPSPSILKKKRESHAVHCQLFALIANHKPLCHFINLVVKHTPVYLPFFVSPL